MKKITLRFSFVFCLLAIGCATSPMIQPQINSLVVAERFDLARKNLADNLKNYGPNNELLYWLDLGTVEHAAGNWRESIAAFERAKNIYDQLYTISLSKELSTWIINDNSALYHGEDFERAMMSVYQALNFVALGELDEALVEARDVDNKLNIFNNRYPPDAKNVYREDAFVRLLMGLIYEAYGTPQSINDAYISYHKAYEIYKSDYASNYQMAIPEILQENLIATQQYLGFPDDSITAELGNKPKVSIKDRQNKAQIILVHYLGHSPIKHAAIVPIPLPNGNIAKLTFPTYQSRVYTDKDFKLIVKRDGKVTSSQTTELVQSIEAVAVQNLKNRLARVIAKAILRTGLKQVALDSVENSVRDQYGHTTGDVTKIIGNIVAFYSESADLRGWQTLPAQVRLARVFVDPGEYTVYIDDKPLGEVFLKPGQVKFLYSRTSR